MTESHPGPLRLRPSSLMCFLLRAEQEPTFFCFIFGTYRAVQLSA